jgi:hypothetical protein
VSTRRLITLALLCGLAILLAGGLWLVLAARGGDEELVASNLPVGAEAVVGGVTATVVDVERSEEGILALAVRMAAGDQAAGDPSRGWAVVSTRGLVERAEEQGVSASGCAGQDVPAGATVECTVRFRLTDEQAASALRAVFGRDGQRASWDLDRPR